MSTLVEKYIVLNQLDMHRASLEHENLRWCQVVEFSSGQSDLEWCNNKIAWIVPFKPSKLWACAGRYLESVCTSVLHHAADSLSTAQVNEPLLGVLCPNSRRFRLQWKLVNKRSAALCRLFQQLHAAGTSAGSFRRRLLGQLLSLLQVCRCIRPYYDIMQKLLA